MPQWEEMSTELARRMARPQRHRLLQGYPMLPQLQTVETSDPVEEPLLTQKKVNVGVLPHAFCNPTVAGCGFCTFPNEPWSAPEARQGVQSVIQEIQTRTAAWPQRRIADALYFGGGTANLIHPDSFSALCEAVVAAVDLTRAEVTLEGVPAYFLSRKAVLLDILQAMPVRHRRISMGIQTFDPVRLAAMGRTAFGDRDRIAQVVEAAASRGMSTSGDLLFNLPGQRREEMLADLRTGVELGLDQICIYNLVLFEGLGTPWSHDPALLAGMPTNTEACGHWLALREYLLAQGFVQTTLTNFERAAVRASEKRFRYELCGYTPALYDVWGFGPGGMSVMEDASGWIKVVNTPQGSQYNSLVASHGRAHVRYHSYSYAEVDVLGLTRALARLRLGWNEQMDGVTSFEEVWAATDAAGLTVSTKAGAVELTPKGMFYADAIAGCLSAMVRDGRAPVSPTPRRVQDLIAESPKDWMG